MDAIIFNIQCDVPNLNGRVYPKEAIDGMLERMNDGKKTLFITLGRPNLPFHGIDLNSVIGIVEKGSLTDDGHIAFDFFPIKGRESFFELSCDYLTVGHGTVKQMKKKTNRKNGIRQTLNVVNDYKLISISMVPKQTKEDECPTSHQ